MSPFLAIHVFPRPYDKEVDLSWEVDPTIRPANFVVFRSDDGVSGWEIVGQVYDVLDFTDKVVIPNTEREYYYRICAQAPGKRYDSDPVSWRGHGKPGMPIYGAANAVIQASRLDFRTTGTEFLVYRLLRRGDRCGDCSDVDTGQLLASSRCPKCYGTGIVGGYADSLSVLGKVLGKKRGPRVHTQTNVTQDTSQLLRLLPFPTLEKNDVVMDKTTSRMFVVADYERFRFNNIVPVAGEAQVEILPTADIRYTLPR